MKYHVYLLIKANDKSLSWDNRIFYVGITNNLTSRMSSHKNPRHADNPYKSNIINKHGFFPLVLWTVESPEEAMEREIFLIRWFGRKCDGGQLTNIAEGGYEKKNTIVSQETRLKIRDNSLSKPYEEVLIIIQDFLTSGLTESQYYKKHKIGSQVFTGWLRRYLPNYISSSSKVDEKISKISEQYALGKSISEISSSLNISFETVRKYLNKNCNRRNHRIIPIYSEDDVNSHIEKFKSSGLSVRKYCKESGVSKRTMLRWIDRYSDIELKCHNKKDYEEGYAKEYIISHLDSYIKSNIPLVKYARGNNIDPRYFQKWARNHNYEVRFIKQLDITKQQEIKELAINGASISDIYKKLKLSKTTIKKYLTS